MASETPIRDIEAPIEAPKETPVTAPVETVPAKAEAKEERATWRSKFGVKEEAIIEEIERVKIVAGVNEYKGNYLVFLAKETSPTFARQFFSMPAYVWEKALPQLQRLAGSIAEIEKKAMANAVLVELKRLKELGIDIKALVKEV